MSTTSLVYNPPAHVVLPTVSGNRQRCSVEWSQLRHVDDCPSETWGGPVRYLGVVRSGVAFGMGDSVRIAVARRSADDRELVFIGDATHRIRAWLDGND